MAGTKIFHSRAQDIFVSLQSNVFALQTRNAQHRLMKLW
jgi:hypothetical protein